MSNKTTKILLAAPHTHGGKRYQKGDILSVDEPTAAWLQARNVGALYSEPAAAKKHAEPTNIQQPNGEHS